MSAPLTVRGVLQRHHEASQKSLTQLQTLLLAEGLDYSKSTVHNRLNGQGITPEDLQALSKLWALSIEEKKELYEAAGYLVILAA